MKNDTLWTLNNSCLITVTDKRNLVVSRPDKRCFNTLHIYLAQSITLISAIAPPLISAIVIGPKNPYRSDTNLNPIENLLLDLRRAVYVWSPCSLTEPNQFCKEWSKIAASRCATLIETYPHRLSAVIVAKVAATKYWLERGQYLSKSLILHNVFLINWHYFCGNS